MTREKFNGPVPDLVLIAFVVIREGQINRKVQSWTVDIDGGIIGPIEGRLRQSSFNPEVCVVRQTPTGYLIDWSLGRHGRKWISIDVEDGFREVQSRRPEVPDFGMRHVKIGEL